MPLPATEVYEFGAYRIDAGERLLRRGDELIPLPPKVACTLLALVRNAGRMVDKGDLMKTVWPDTFVEEGALTRNISLLRKTLGDTGDEPAYIETIPRRGYRFIAPVRAAAVEPAATAEVELQASHELAPGNGEQREAVKRQAAAWRSRAKWIGLAAVLLLVGIGVAAKFIVGKADTRPGVFGVAPANALAVLPFRSVEPDGSQSYFAYGMTQAIVTRLTTVRNLRVVSFASAGAGQSDATAWEEILRNQSIQWVLTGTVLHSGGRVRIDAHLIDPRTRALGWAKSYDRKVEDVLDLQSAVAEAIASEIQVSVTTEDRERLRQRRQVKPEALDAYLQGRYFWNRRTEDGLKRAAQYFQQAIAVDATYAPAHAGLADAYSLLGSIGTDGLPPNQAMPLAKAAAQKAIELDPELSEGHVSLAYVSLSYDWDLPGAARGFARALELNPSSATARHWYSHYFMAAGDLGKAAEQMREALQLEPLSPSINIGVGWCLYYSRRYDDAIKQFRSVAEVDPTFPLAHQTLGMAYQQKGQFEQAIEEYKRAAALSNNSPAAVAGLASAYAAGGRLPEARQELARLEEMSHSRYVPAFYFATVHYAQGDLARTFEWGWKAIGERCDYLMYLGVEPRVGRLAGHPEFIRAMAALHK
jgi:TolB-like protein/DNA-binding winged helix-turn-helix (wHTH) protein/cytochrome c-type biogenesis protein CcmH/NrfG